MKTNNNNIKKSLIMANENQTNSNLPSDKSGWANVLGCLGKILSFFFVMAMTAGIRTCVRKQFETNLNSNSSYNVTKVTSDYSENEFTSTYLDEDIKIAVENTKRNLPMQVDEFTTAVDFECTDKAVVYTYEVDDTDFDLSLIDAQDIKKDIACSLNKNNRDMNVLAHFCIETGRKWTYKYVGYNSGYELRFSFSTEELKKKFN